MGSLPFWAFQFLQETGVTTLECSPYVSGQDGTVPKCTDSAKQCANSSEPFRLYKAANYTQVGSFWNPAGHIEAIMEALLHGPVDATFNVWSDFDEYSGGVYRYRHGTYEGLHSVKVIGYGVETSEDGLSTEEYWLVQNSWGPNWGPYNGHFKILKGANECEFESLMYTASPLLQW